MRRVGKVFVLFLCLSISNILISADKEMADIDSKVEMLLKKMTLEEKIGQLVQYSGSDAITGPGGAKFNVEDEIKKGKVGSFLNIVGVNETRRIQKVAVEESRLKIPLVFALDVIHGYKTIFPVPIALASSWNMDAIEKSSRIAADEASASGIHWTFAPMVDIARDPRWGRVVEGAGEDPYLGACIAKAYVRGFQGKNLSDNDTILACAKHYIGYGAATAGRDYNNADIPMRTLWEIYLPPFQGALDAGVRTIMTAFNNVNGIPMTGNRKLLNGLLRDKLGFKGFTVSDWNSVDEMVNHGYAETRYQAGKFALDAGLDMDMVSGIYSEELPKLLKNKQITEKQIDDAVRRILKAKFELGLFDDPYKYCNEEREEKVILSENNRKAAREIATKCAVLLKNENDLLPLSKNIKNIALVGPLAHDRKNLKGPWWAMGRSKDCISVYEGIKNKVSKDTKLIYSKGCEIKSAENDKENISLAVKASVKADVIVAVVGESLMMSGEAHSRADTSLPGNQLELLKELKKTGKPIVVVLMNGRPLIMNWIKENIPAILETWYLGTETGNAVADILFGDYNPSGKLTITFEYAVGQIPVFYNHRNTGRPNVGDGNYFVTKYIDIPNKPLYPFGYGLSYTKFDYSEIDLDKHKISKDESIIASIEVKNIGKFKGTETVQVYIQDLFASVTQPIRRLIDFKQVELDPGDSEKIEFKITPDKLEIFNQDMKKVVEPGDFKVYIGTSSEDVKFAKFTVIDGKKKK